jgi:ribosome biogenesis GTPase
VGLWGDGDAAPEGFDDVDALAAACRFRDCAHDREPGCAVTAAVGDGTLAQDRLQRYRRLQRELAHVARQQDALLRREQARRWRAITRSLRDHPKLQGR